MGLLGKLLLTATVIAGVLMYLRYRQLQAPVPHREPPRVVNAKPAKPAKRSGVGWLASLVVLIFILSSGFWLYSYWLERHEILYVRVVDAGSGHATEYRAYRSDIDDREFLTIGGKRVRLAETERLETTMVPPSRN